MLLCGWFNGCNFYTKIEAIETEKKMKIGRVFILITWNWLVIWDLSILCWWNVNFKMIWLQKKRGNGKFLEFSVLIEFLLLSKSNKWQCNSFNFEMSLSRMWQKRKTSQNGRQREEIERIWCGRNYSFYDFATLILTFLRLPSLWWTFHFSSVNI